MPQIITITSEAIQAQIRRLLPSQQGFGIDMEASSVITPIIDVTPAAEGSQLPAYLQTAYSFDSNTAIDVTNTQTNFAVSPGFYRLSGAATIQTSNSADRGVSLFVRDASGTKRIWGLFAKQGGTTGGLYLSERVDEYIFLQTGDSLEVAASADCNLRGSFRQIADATGNLINPVGFNFE